MRVGTSRSEMMVCVVASAKGSASALHVELTPGSRQAAAFHKTPYGVECKAWRSTLAHRFTTDVIRLQFLQSMPSHARTPQGFGWSLGYALVEGAAFATGAPSSDLSVTVTYDPATAIPPLILYDSVPGGAGLVASLEQEARLRDAVVAAVERVSGDCGCGEDESCYGCLRSYRNQFVHAELQRGPVLHYLKSILERWPES